MIYKPLNFKQLVALHGDYAHHVLFLMVIQLSLELRRRAFKPQRAQSFAAAPVLQAPPRTASAVATVRILFYHSEVNIVHAIVGVQYIHHGEILDEIFPAHVEDAVFFLLGLANLQGHTGVGVPQRRVVTPVAVPLKPTPK